MDTFKDFIFRNLIQCWGCPVFDRLFEVISKASSLAYDYLSKLCIFSFLLFIGFYVLSSVWNNIKSGFKDPLYQKSLKPVIINSLIIFSLLGLGVSFPRFLTTITFEPVADMTLFYTQSILKIDNNFVENKVNYTPRIIEDDGFYRPVLRDKIISIIKTTITQFQSYISLGFAIVDKAFSWKSFLGIGSFIKNLILLYIGLFFIHGFFKLFIKYCFYFIDVIISMTYFAFFFPVSMTVFIFKNSDVPSLVKGIGASLGTSKFKSVINSIVTLATATLTYLIAIMIISRFFGNHGISVQELMYMITSNNVSEDIISDESIVSISLISILVILYMVNFISTQVDTIKTMILKAFEVGEEKTLGEELFSNVKKLKDIIVNKIEGYLVKKKE